MATGSLKPKISLFFPVYNDERTVEAVTTKSVETLSAVAEDYEIVIVDDGSPDGSGAVADEMARRFDKVRVIHHPTNLGYGAALQSGFRAANHFEWVCFLDGDDQYDVRELVHLVKLLPRYDGVVTFRYRKTYGPWRKFVSAVFNLVARCMFGTRFRDANSGLRIVRRTVIDDLPLTSASPFLGAELAIRAALKGYRIGEAGISMYPRDHGSSGVVTPRNILATIGDMLAVRRDVFRNRPR